MTVDSMVKLSVTQVGSDLVDSKADLMALLWDAIEVATTAGYWGTRSAEEMAG